MTIRNRWQPRFRFEKALFFKTNFYVFSLLHTSLYFSLLFHSNISRRTACLARRYVGSAWNHLPKNINRPYRRVSPALSNDCKIVWRWYIFTFRLSANMWNDLSISKLQFIIPAPMCSLAQKASSIHRRQALWISRTHVRPRRSHSTGRFFFWIYDFKLTKVCNMLPNFTVWDER